MSIYLWTRATVDVMEQIASKMNIINASQRTDKLMDLLLAQKRLLEVLEILDKNDQALAAIHVVNALEMLAGTIAANGADNNEAAPKIGSRLN